jgi:hypothetical protein
VKIVRFELFLVASRWLFLRVDTDERGHAAVAAAGRVTRGLVTTPYSRWVTA